MAEKNTTQGTGKITELDFMKDDERDLSRVEYQNIKEKSELGAIPVEYLRKNLFNPTAIKDATVPANFKKVVFENDEYKISINKYLNQRHKDVLTVLFSDNLGVSNPTRDGSYCIYTNLTHIAKLLGYANPNSSIQRVKQYLNDLRFTDIVVYDKKLKIEHGHQLLGEYSLDTENGFYKVMIPSKTAKYHILNFAVEIPKEMNRLILDIPIKFSKLKATISYLLSNKSLKNGIGLETIMKQFDMNITPKTKSLFKKEIEDNIELLNSFNIQFDSLTKNLSLKKEMNFLRNVTHNEALESYKKEGRIEVLDKKPKDKSSFVLDIEEVKDLTWLMLRYQNKYIRIENKNYLIKEFIRNENGTVSIEAEHNTKTVKIPTALKDIEQIHAKITAYNMAYFDSREDMVEVAF